MKAIALLVSFLICLTVFSGGCGGGLKATVTLDELVANPQQYNKKTVTVDGIYIGGWEFTILANDIQYTGNGEQKELTKAGSAIWFAGFLPLKVQGKLYQHTSPDAGLEHYGKVRVTGLFEYGGPYGYGNAYRCRINLKAAEWLDWTPPE